MDLDPFKLRGDFPILKQKVHGKALVYFDNAATTQKPTSVTNAVCDYYNTYNSNIHRGVHYLSQVATNSYERARETIRTFINAGSSREVIFTRGTTESINLIASSFGRKFLKPGDEVLISWMEHHSNIVPWQFACEASGAILKVIPITDKGEIDRNAYSSLLTEKTKIVAITHVSNALGTIVPVKEMIAEAHLKHIPVLIDGAQAISHLRVDVLDLDADFYCFSGHKMYAPMGIGILYGKEKWLEMLPPYQGGGEMIQEVSFAKTTFNELPFKFEAGTPNVGDAIGLEKAVHYMLETGVEQIAAHEHSLLQYGTEQLLQIPGIRIIGNADNKAAVISFIHEEIHPFDMGTILDQLGIAIRTGNHCAQPLMERFNIQGTMRASFALYNTKEEIDVLITSLNRAIKMFI
jgi:cysteine desulfurase/selenocysteine lyase